ncbi:MAG: type VI secretion system tube protein Hcp [Planctomycetota bacterium]
MFVKKINLTVTGITAALLFAASAPAASVAITPALPSVLLEEEPEFDIFVRIPGIIGGATHPAYQGWIQVESSGMDLTNGATLSMMGGAGGAGRVRLSEMVLSGGLDMALPPLVAACATAQPFDKVEIHFLRTDGSSALPALEIGLGQVLITKVEHVFDPDPQQQMSLLFGKVQWRTRSASGQTQFACWDMVKNKACSAF